MIITDESTFSTINITFWYTQFTIHIVCADSMDHWLYT